MKSFNKLENELYRAIYDRFNVEPDGGKALWEEIKNNKELLNWAITPCKDKFGERMLVNGLCICDTILVDYNNVDLEVYQKLVNEIYESTDIARIVLDGYSNGGFSFLLMTLWNKNLKLTEEQKAFAVSEAMNKIGTSKYHQAQEEYSRLLDSKGITDEETTVIELGGQKNPVGLKTGTEYMHNLFNSLSDTQAHGSGEFDIRYWILRNPNWTDEEKKKLVFDFYYSDVLFVGMLDEWEWGIINNNRTLYGEPIMDISEIYELSEIEIEHRCSRNINPKDIIDEINFCKMMREIRFPKEEDFYLARRKLED